MTKNLIDPQDLSVAEIDGILTLAQKIIDDPDKYSEVCKRK